MGIALIILLVLAFLLIQWLRTNPATVQRWVARRMARHMQRQMEEQMRRQQQAAYSRRQAYNQGQNPGFNQGQSYSQARDNAQMERYYRRRQRHIIPPEYAVNVKFTETHEQRTETTRTASGKEETVRTESQVSDVEWVEIRNNQK